MPFQSPVVVDGIVDSEKLSQLLTLGTEYPDLDYKRKIDTGTTEGTVKLARHVGAMRVGGGYIVGGVDGSASNEQHPRAAIGGGASDLARSRLTRLPRRPPSSDAFNAPNKQRPAERSRRPSP
jgi:hypothetical protein